MLRIIDTNTYQRELSTEENCEDRRKGRCICDSMHPRALSGVVDKSINFQRSQLLLVLSFSAILN